MEQVELNCEQSGDEGDGGENEEEAVNFLVEFPVPCLICGVNLKVDDVVKQEASDFDCSLMTGEDTGTIFNWFLKWFGVDIGKNRKQSKVNRGGLDEDNGDRDILKFCGICKSELIGILELQRQLDELEKKIKNGLDAVKGNMIRCEETFQINGVYGRDQRYKRVRSRIIKCGNSGNRPQKNDKPSKETKRKSTRKKNPVSRFNSPSNYEKHDDDHLLPLPDYMLPSPDQASVQKRLIIPEEENPGPGEGLDIKPDITFIHESNHSLPPPASQPSSSSKNVRKPAKKKEKKKNIPKFEIKLGTKSKAQAPPPKKSKRPTKAIKPKAPAPPSSPPNLDDNSDNYFLEDNFNEDSESNDNPSPQDKPSSSRPQRRKRRKIYIQVDEDSDSDFKLDGGDDQDNSLSEEDQDWNLKITEPYQRYTYKSDPSTNTISVGAITFSISGDATKVTCTTCITAAIPPMKNNKDAMRRHMTKYHTNRYTCPQCPFRGESTGPLRVHIQTVHEGKPPPPPKQRERFPCQICGKPIRHQRNHEWSHMSQEEREEVISKEPHRLPDWLRRRIQCEDCGKEFRNEWHLRRHREREHEGLEKEKELCPECGGTFKELERHRRSQHGGMDGGRVEGRFECCEEGCGKRFTKLKGLTRHKEAVHWKIRPWRCEVCGRGFSAEKTLKEHLNGHLGVRPWRCEGGGGCEAAFNRKSHLQRHMRIYHEEGAMPKRKVFLRGPTVLGQDFKKKELQREGTYYPPSALRGWAKGRVPGHLMGKGEEGVGEG